MTAHEHEVTSGSAVIADPLAVPSLSVQGISKRFGVTRALSDVSFSVSAGEVVGLIGENGAGKSTALKIISGNLRPDSGTILIRGRETSFHSYRQATLEGVFQIYQDLALVPNLTVSENLFLSHEDRFTRLGAISNRRMRKHATELLEKFGHERIDPSRRVADYDFSTQQAIEIVKAFALADLLGVSSPVLLLDEPTAALARDEVEFLFQMIERVRQNSAIVFVSHRLSEVLELSDRVIVLKDGCVTAEVAPKDTSEADIHELMVGRVREAVFYRENLQREPDVEPVLEVHGLSRAGSFRDVDLVVRSGEIVGVAGLIGSGKSELARAIFGALGGTTGEVRVGGLLIERPSIATMSKAGVGYVPPDRQTDGIIQSMPVSSNISLAHVARATGTRSALLGLRQEEANALRHVDRLRIKTAGTRALAGTLSGGNQQKVVLARWLDCEPKVLILDNPTQGVDAGAKEDIYEVIRLIVAEGVGILLVSDDLLELIGLSNCIHVMKGGVIVKTVAAPPEHKPNEVILVAEMV